MPIVSAPAQPQQEARDLSERTKTVIAAMAAAALIAAVVTVAILLAAM
jgi:hypothetical protein